MKSDEENTDQVKYHFSLKIGPGSYLTVNIPKGGNGTVSVYSLEAFNDGGNGERLIKIGSGKYINGKGKSC